MVPTRVLHITPCGWGAGGIEGFIMSMLENVDRELVEFDVLAIVETDVPGVHDGRLSELGGRRYIHVERGRGPTLSKLGPLRAIYDVVRRNGYQTVHIHTGSPFHGLYAYAARFAGASTVIMHSHTTYWVGLPPLLRRVLDITLSPAPSHRFACSRAAGEWLFPRRLQSTVRILRNGIDVEAFRYDPTRRARMRDELGVTDGQLVLGHVGRFSYEKNHPLLLRVFRALLEVSADARRPLLVCVGDGDDRPAIETMAEEMGVADQIRFLGLRDDVPDLMQAMDVLILPSRNEGLGIVGIEAQAAGLPCVFSTGVPGEADITGRCTFLAESAPAEEWARATLQSGAEPRVDGAEQVRVAGYDSARCAAELQAFYLRSRQHP
jgi:glycosyltransferase involved in cell wall biosynthesis